jgi:hypothetical protein
VRQRAASGLVESYNLGEVTMHDCSVKFNL